MKNRIYIYIYYFAGTLGSIWASSGMLCEGNLDSQGYHLIITVFLHKLRGLTWTFRAFHANVYRSIVISGSKFLMDILLVIW